MQAPTKRTTIPLIAIATSFIAITAIATMTCPSTHPLYTLKPTHSLNLSVQPLAIYNRATTTAEPNDAKKERKAHVNKKLPNSS